MLVGVVKVFVEMKVVELLMVVTVGGLWSLWRWCWKCVLVTAGG